MNDEQDLICSPLQQSYRAEDQQVEIHIYRMPDTAWTLEIVDENYNSTVWDDTFETDEAALAIALQELREDGIAAFIAGSPGEPGMEWAS